MVNRIGISDYWVMYCSVLTLAPSQTLMVRRTRTTGREPRNRYQECKSRYDNPKHFSRQVPKSGIKDLQKRLNWTSDKKHIKETLDEIERLKALISLALRDMIENGKI